MSTMDPAVIREIFRHKSVAEAASDVATALERVAECKRALKTARQNLEHRMNEYRRVKGLNDFRSEFIAGGTRE